MKGEERSTAERDDNRSEHGEHAYRCIEPITRFWGDPSQFREDQKEKEREGGKRGEEETLPLRKQGV
jgi:hypothetical protein